MNIISKVNGVRKGCHDVWNAYMLKDAIYSPKADMPICPCTAKEAPVNLLSYDDAKTIYNKEIKKGNINFHREEYIHFYIDDQKFDGPKCSIWLKPNDAYEIIRHFGGMITPDFSTYYDFPDALKRYNTFRMRAFGYWIGTKGINVINNVRWGTVETYEYCFDGIPKNSIVAIGTVASGIYRIENRPLFKYGFERMLNELQPSAVVFYGSINYDVIQDNKILGIPFIPFESKTSLAFKNGGNKNV